MIPTNHDIRPDIELALSGFRFKIRPTNVAELHVRP